MNSLQVMKQTLAYLENGHFTYETKIADDLRAAIKQEEQAKPAAWEHHAKKLTQWLHCMSYNDSYFGEPSGLVKQVTAELNRLIGITQPVPVKTYSGGRAWPVQTEWAGLTDEG